MNKPYVKVYDKDGNLLNPLIGSHYNKYMNRRQRKERLKKLNKN